MNKDIPLDQIQETEISTAELNQVIESNKNLYDKLNALPELESLDKIAIE